MSTQRLTLYSQFLRCFAFAKRTDRIGGRLFALLMEAIVSCNSAVRRLRLNRLAVGTHKHAGHETETAVALCDTVTLHVAVVVLARPNEAALVLHRKRDHVVDEPMLVPQAERLELRLVLTANFCLFKVR